MNKPHFNHINKLKSCFRGILSSSSILNLFIPQFAQKLEQSDCLLNFSTNENHSVLSIRELKAKMENDIVKQTVRKSNSQSNVKHSTKFLLILCFHLNCIYSSL